MSVSNDSLRKVLELEAAKGYRDSAVMGGLDKFVATWLDGPGQSGTSLHSGEIKQFVESSSYAALDRGERVAYVKRLLDMLSGGQRKSQSSRKQPASAPAPKRTAAASTRRSPQPASRSPLDSTVTVIKGISSGTEPRLRRLGIRTVRDLLYFFPRRHIDYSQRTTIAKLTEGKDQTVVANVWQAKVVNVGMRRSTEAIVGDETGNMRVVWFNNPYVARSLKTNDRIIISGRVALFRGQHVFESPEWEPAETETLHTGRLVPVYPLTKGLYPRQLRKAIRTAIDQFSTTITDFLPSGVKESEHLLDLPQAITQAHFPDDLSSKDRARIRLAFDELFLLQLGVGSKKRAWQEGQPANAMPSGPAARKALGAFRDSLPFKLTPAQEKALSEILADLAKSRPMSRLLQGDVGSGKTVVATAALIVAAANGYQSAFMAPTEILAEQHFATVTQLLARAGQETLQDDYSRGYTGILDRPVIVGLLTGDMSAAARRSIHQRIAGGEIDIVIGTHAIIQKDVEFKLLGMAVVDEQHRFGVTQRSALRQKGASPHILVMTATPIPRTLALTLYGDLDLSIIDKPPAGRQVIKTKWLQPEQRPAAYSFIRKEVAKGRQAFIICPLVEESEAVQAKAAVAEYERLSAEVFPDLRLGLVHGRMSADEKDGVMHRFRAGEIDILVATPVIEVGIDVPNATVMMVESADRFGLSQLHQFRGRVGRGPEQSYCMLLAEDPSEVGRQRLDIIERVHDGFRLAEEDLKLRGPGEFFGTKQSGLPDLRMAKLSDIAILEAARREATVILQQDPRLRKPEHAPLAAELVRVWPESAEWS